MANITVLFLVLALTGSPVASAACFTWCQQAPVAHGHCHEEMAMTDGLVMTGDFACVERSLVASPYLVEHRPAPGAAVLTTTSSATTALVVRADAPAVVWATPALWAKPPIVLRL